MLYIPFREGTPAKPNSPTPTGEARFDRATFSGYATFEGNARFGNAAFEKDANFQAIRGERGFSMAGAVFDAVPEVPGRKADLVPGTASRRSRSS